MKLPFVPRSTLAATEAMLVEMRSINAGLQARYDALFAEYASLRAKGFEPVRTFDDAPIVVTSVEDADREAAFAEYQRTMIEEYAPK